MPKILLILGAGPNIGSHLAKAFASKGYKVASVSRNKPKVDFGSDLHISADLTKPEQVPGIFQTVREKLGGEVGVVVYNAALRIPDPSPTDPLSLFTTPAELEKYQSSQNANGISVFVAAHEAIAAFRAQSSSAKTFIFTGNALNTVTLPNMLNFGLGKVVPAYTIRYLVEQGIYKDEGIKFYYADERLGSGKPVGMAISGEAAAEAYLALAEQKEQGPWMYTFVKGEGYKDFEAKL